MPSPVPTGAARSVSPVASATPAPSGEGFTSAQSFRALVAGLWALPLAVVLLLVAYGLFLAYCKANPLAVAAFFGESSSVETAAPVIIVLLILAVGMVCASYLVIARDPRRVPLVAASACVSLSLTLAVPAIMLRPPEPPSLVSARLEGTKPDAEGRFQRVRALLQVDVASAGEYRLEPALNGVQADPLLVSLRPGVRVVEVEFLPAQALSAVKPLDGIMPDVTVTLKVLQHVEGEGYRPVQALEWPIPYARFSPVLRQLSRG